jgi:hypothetical protein
MAWDKKSRTTCGVLVGLAVLVAGLGVFMPDIRGALVFKPRQGRAETAVMQLATHENRLRRGKGRFDTFTPPQAAQHARALGLNMQDWPGEDFLFDASLMPDKTLRLRALPRPESVRDLKVGGQIFVAELAPRGGINRSGWYP